MPTAEVWTPESTPFAARIWPHHRKGSRGNTKRSTNRCPERIGRKKGGRRRGRPTPPSAVETVAGSSDQCFSVDGTETTVRTVCTRVTWTATLRVIGPAPVAD